jgi:hypothetical protein
VSSSHDNDDRFLLGGCEIDATPRVSNQRRGLSSRSAVVRSSSFDPQIGLSMAAKTPHDHDQHHDIKTMESTFRQSLANDRQKDLSASTRSDRTERLRSESRRHNRSMTERRRSKSKDENDNMPRRRKSSDGTDHRADYNDLVASIRSSKKSPRSKSMDQLDGGGGGGVGMMIMEFPTSILKKSNFGTESKNVKPAPSKSSQGVTPPRRLSQSVEFRLDHDAAAPPVTEQEVRPRDAAEVRKKPEEAKKHTTAAFSPPTHRRSPVVEEKKTNRSVSLYDGILGKAPDPLEERLQARRTSIGPSTTPRRGSNDGGASVTSTGTTRLSKIEAYIVTHETIQTTSREKSSPRPRKFSRSPVPSSRRRRSAELLLANSSSEANNSSFRRRSMDGGPVDPIDDSFESFLAKYNSRVTDPAGTLDGSQHSSRKNQDDCKNVNSRRRSKSVDPLEMLETKKGSSGKSKKNRDDPMADIVSIDLKDLLESAMMMETAEQPAPRPPMRSSSMIDAMETETRAQVKEFSRRSRHTSMYVDAKEKHTTIERAAMSRLDEKYRSRETSSFMTAFTQNMDESDRAVRFRNGQSAVQGDEDEMKGVFF